MYSDVSRDAVRNATEPDAPGSEVPLRKEAPADEVEVEVVEDAPAPKKGGPPPSPPPATAVEEEAVAEEGEAEAEAAAAAEEEEEAAAERREREAKWARWEQGGSPLQCSPAGGAEPSGGRGGLGEAVASPPHAVEEAGARAAWAAQAVWGQGSFFLGGGANFFEIF